MIDIIILGATGSIGKQAISLIKDSQEYNLIGFTFDRNYKEALKILDEFPNVKAIGINDSKIASIIEERYKNSLSIFKGEKANIELINCYKGTFILNALSGISGIEPSFEAIKNKSILALANKETIVVGGELFKKYCKQYDATIYPVDSEHSTLYKLLSKFDKDEINKIVITASGGSLRNFDLSKLSKATINDVLNHPTWKMGAKITVDCATMINKAFEVIEASVLFNYPIDKIEVLMHDQSLIHAGLRTVDDSLVLESGPNDMRIPLAYALNGMKRIKVKDVSKLLLNENNPLTFRTFDEKRYPIFNFTLDAFKKGGTALAIINASDEIAVNAFLENKIKYTNIYDVIRQTFNRCRIAPVDYLEDIMYALKTAKDEALKVIESL